MSHKPERRDPDRKCVLRLNSSELDCRANRCWVPRPIRKIVPIEDYNCVSLPVGRRNAASCVRLNAQSPTKSTVECHLDAFAIRSSRIARYNGPRRMSKKIVW